MQTNEEKKERIKATSKMFDPVILFVIRSSLSVTQREKYSQSENIAFAFP